jgi:tripartite-type tricarboxylate transporter receptor subunit TctC
MISIRSVMAIVVAVAAIHLHTSALAGSWPERTVRVITPGAPGSSIDVAARLFAERLAELWGKPVVIDNRSGADGIMSVQAFLQGNDGHSLLFAFPGIVTVVPLLHDSLPYDPVNDLIPITSAAYDFLCVAVPGKLPVLTLGDLVAFAKSRPGKLNWVRQALDDARKRGTLSWELRAATSLARLLRSQGRCADAIACLQPIYDRFTEGFGTADLIGAKQLLDDLSTDGRR